MIEMEENNVRVSYQLGDALGKGAFGVVYRAIDVESGEVVAIKQLRLTNIHASEINILMVSINRQCTGVKMCIIPFEPQTEIDLLKKLKSICKKFGRFPETLIAVYVSQVLEGLCYLHEQGVIHRDIKGANILTTKDGQVKLADFGVATRPTESSEKTVVGSPYWSEGTIQLAPEVIELNGATTASDIWSLGCTLIELLNGEPPYYNLSPMSALFRIVQDDHPPLPEGISPALKDFLTHCFQKDCNLRVSARKLLKHPWITNGRRKITVSVESSKNVLECISEGALKWDGSEQQVQRVELHASLRKPLEPSPTDRSPSKNEDSIPEKDNWDEDFEDNALFDDLNLPQGDQRRVSTLPLHSRGVLEVDLDELPKVSPENGRSNPLIDATHSLVHYKDSDDDDFASSFDLPLTPATTANAQSSAEMGWVRISHKEDGGMADGADPFAALDESFDEDDFEADRKKDHFAHGVERVLSLFKLLESQHNEVDLVSTCNQLIDAFTEQPAMKRILISHHCLMRLVDLLERCPIMRVKRSFTELMLELLEGDISEHLCLLGVLPIVITLTDGAQEQPTRLAGARFIRQICNISPLALQMFVSCRGLAVLVNMLDAQYLKDRDILWIAIDVIASVMDLQSATPKNDFCRIFARLGLLGKLARVLGELNSDKDPEAAQYVPKIVNVFLMFSQADNNVKETFASDTMLKSVIDEMDHLTPSLCIAILKALKNVSMSSSSLSALHRAGVIPRLLYFLDNQDGPYLTEVYNQILHTMYNLCRIDKERQEVAARAGIIPYLIHTIRGNSPLKQFALPILCDLAHAGKVCRMALWENDGLRTYLDLLKDTYWQINALEAIVTWLLEETEPVERILAEPISIEHLVRAMTLAQAQTFENILDPVYKMLCASKLVARTLGRSRVLTVLLPRLNDAKAIVR
ncbi:hypothetical protein M427DRAFT_143501, partial [Gonapodya prolifera JEL478]